MPGWFLDELSSAGGENVDPRHAALYDQKENAAPEEEVELLVEFGLGEGSVVVDLGAGTGQFALAVARRCARVVAVDVSPVMLAQLRAKLDRSSGRLATVEVVEAGFLIYRHVGPTADFVYSRWALHHLADFWKVLALRRMHAMMTPGGLLRLSDVAFSFTAAGAESAIDRWCATLPEEATGEAQWTRADIAQHVRDEHSTFTWLLEPMMRSAGFRIEQARYSPDGVLAEYVARAV